MSHKYRHPAFHRNYGFFSEEEQRALHEATVAIAGVGGDGFQLGFKLAMMGVGRLKVADPEVFEVENANRVIGAVSPHIGKNKAETFREMVRQLPSPPEVIVYSEGVTEKNVGDFIDGADLLLDESELTYLHIGTMLAREARKRNIPELFVMNVGFAGVATSFKPSGGKTFEQLMGIPADASLAQIAKMKVDFTRCLPYIPPYGDPNTLKEVMGGAPLPSISHGVDVASAIGSTEAFLHLTAHVGNHRKSPTWSPKFRYMDAYTGKARTIHFPRLSYMTSAAHMMLRSKLGATPLASYGHSERKRRSKQL